MPGIVTCERCGKEFERKSDRGVPPKLCYDGPCRGELKAEQGHQLNPRLDGQAATVPRLNEMEKEAEAARAAARDHVPEPSWLDEPEIQDQLAQRNEDATVVYSDAFSPDPDADASHPECRAPECGAQPLHPDSLHLFCLPHWLRLNLDLRATLLGAEPGSAPFNATVIRAIRSLR